LVAKYCIAALILLVANSLLYELVAGAEQLASITIVIVPSPSLLFSISFLINSQSF
jgi:hypothetical protein